LQPAADMAGDLFDNWFDPLEAEVRARSREFIEELLRGELEAALSRPVIVGNSIRLVSAVESGDALG
jgi:hypothetical protein